MKLRGAAGDIEGRDDVRFQEPEACVDNVRGHDFRAIRSGIDVTVMARLIAALADVDLQHRYDVGVKPLVTAGCNRFLERPCHRHGLHRRPLSGSVSEGTAGVEESG
jgi:hypothetical protein